MTKLPFFVGSVLGLLLSACSGESVDEVSQGVQASRPYETPGEKPAPQKPLATCAATLCAPGLVCIDTPEGAQCVSRDPCAGFECPKGQHCVAPADAPMCQPDQLDPCASQPCGPGERCIVEEVTCVRAPCPPIAHCLSDCACTKEYKPVCGANGVTFGNSCEAKCAGVEIAYESECRADCICPKIYAPVCGANGVTFGNSCEAKCAGVEIAYESECRADCICPKIYAPVCGADGRTYGNSCEAKCAGVGLAYEGECKGVCTYQGVSYPAGASFLASDGCNKCQCERDGRVACTLLGCANTCNYQGTVYKGGEYFPAGDGCNTCSCTQSGQVVCSLRACPAPGCRRTGCSGQLCADHDLVSTCEGKPEYACYKEAVCERQPGGECGFTPTPELKTCLGQFTSSEVSCGGIAAFQCPGAGACVDDPRDNCDPDRGGADCGGLCRCDVIASCKQGSHWDSSAAVCACVANLEQ